VKDKVRETILGLIRKKKNMQGLGEDDNYFDLGVSSLTIIELQIGVEEELGIAIPTSQLMRLSTIRGWIDAYAAAAEEHARRRTTEVETTSLAGELQ
jgi:D-alanine--poly(phosphoribitol) ligase subunit 2